MPFIVRRTNNATQDVQDSPQQFTTRRDAFDAAWDNCGTFIKQVIRASHAGDVNFPPSSGARYKVWVETRQGNSQGVHLRYDYHTPPVGFDTNDITWILVEVP